MVILVCKRRTTALAASNDSVAQSSTDPPALSSGLTQPVQNGGQFVGDCATLVAPQLSARPIEQHDVLWLTHDGITTDFHAEEPGEVA